MIKRISLVIGLLSSITINSQIIESDTIAEVLNHIEDQDTLVVFDIDNTLAAPQQELGSDEWFNFMIQEKMAEGFDFTQAANIILPTYFHIQFHISLLPIEEQSSEILYDLIQRGIPTMALTARSIYVANRTHEQLNQINIAFSMPHAQSQELALSMPKPCIYKHGILFSDQNDKGETLLCFLDNINYHPKKIIFVDDKFKNLRAVEDDLFRRQISFLGIRFTRCDEKIKNFDGAKAAQQLHQFLQERYGAT